MMNQVVICFLTANLIIFFQVPHVRIFMPIRYSTSVVKTIEVHHRWLNEQKIKMLCYASRTHLYSSFAQPSKPWGYRYLWLLLSWEINLPNPLSINIPDLKTPVWKSQTPLFDLLMLWITEDTNNPSNPHAARNYKAFLCSWIGLSENKNAETLKYIQLFISKS